MAVADVDTGSVRLDQEHAVALSAVMGGCVHADAVVSNRDVKRGAVDPRFEVNVAARVGVGVHDRVRACLRHGEEDAGMVAEMLPEEQVPHQVTGAGDARRVTRQTNLEARALLRTHRHGTFPALAWRKPTYSAEAMAEGRFSTTQ